MPPDVKLLIRAVVDVDVGLSANALVGEVDDFFLKSLVVHGLVLGGGGNGSSHNEEEGGNDADHDPENAQRGLT